jgi:hypothetical protein
MERMNLNDGFKSAMAENGFTDLQTANVAVGGTSLSQWEKTGELYPSLVSKIQNRTTDRELLAVLFSQGENEGLPNGEDPTTWRIRFERLVDDLRADLNKPELVVVFMQIGRNQGYGAAWDEVKAQQAAVNKPGVYMVASDDIEQSADHLHYELEAYNEFGKRLASILCSSLVNSHVIGLAF